MTTLDPTRNMERPLLRTKISAPRISPEFVHRSRLTQRIDRGVVGPLTLLAAPAGFGKTNLLIEWAKDTRLPVAWLNLDGDDNDIGRFFRYLIGALQSIEPQLGEEALDFIQSTRGSGLEIGLTYLINEIATLPREIVLVLDDFQTLDNAALLRQIDFLLKHLPHNLHLVIASRSEPALDLAFLRVKGWVIELGQDDLRFNDEEVALFFRQAMRLELPTELVQALERHTEGWITALQMAAVSLQHEADPAALLASLQGGAHYLVDFLAEEVLDRQPEEMRQFLLRSSVLDQLTGSLCEAVIKPEAQPGYGVVMLNRLEHARLFITALDEKHEWFRYHPLFADFLRHIQAEINPAEIPLLQKRAALWFEQNASLNEAFQFALASADVEWAADLIERNTQAMVKTGEIFTLARWIGKLPDRVIHQRPRLSLTYAWGAIAAYQLDLARYWLDDLQRTLDQSGEPADASAPTREPQTASGFESAGPWNIHGGLAICRSTLAMLNGDVELAAEFSRQATSYLQEDNPFVNSLLALEDSLYFILSGDTVKAIESLRNTVQIARQANNLMVMIIATCQQADMQALQGQLSQAWAALQKAQFMATGPDGRPLPLASLVDIGFGEILLERGMLEEATIYLERGCQVARSIWSISNLDGLVSLARLRQVQGNVAGSQAIIAEASHMAFSTESSQWDDTLVSAIAVRLALQRDDLAGAERWWQKGGFPDFAGTISLANYPYHIFEYLLITQARFLLTIGLDTGDRHDLHQAAGLLDTLLLEAERFQRVTPKIEILILQALAQNALGEERATDTLLHALALGEPEGYHQIYLDEGQRLAGLLQQCQAAQQESGSYLPSSAYIQSLCEAIQCPTGTPPAAQRAVEQPAVPLSAQEDGLPIFLSARELEVLALIAEGKSNQEISARLYLALNTVKRHAYNIYAKLDVKNRTQAVAKARQLGLIP